MALTFELCEPTALAEGGNFIYVSIKKTPKLALSAHKASAIGRYASGTATDSYIKADSLAYLSAVHTEMVS